MFLSLNLCGALLRVKVVVVVVTYERSEIPAALLRNGLILRLMDIIIITRNLTSDIVSGWLVGCPPKIDDDTHII